MDPVDVALFNFQMREQLLNDALQVGWTALQRIQMVMREKKKLDVNGRVTAPRLSQHVAKVRISAGAETISPAFIDVALTIDMRLFAVNDAKTYCSALTVHMVSKDPWTRSTSYRRSLTGARRPATSRGLSLTLKTPF